MHVNRMQSGYSQTRHIRAGFFMAFALFVPIFFPTLHLSAQTGDHAFSEEAAEVSDISFQGNRSFSDGDLRDLLATKTTPAGVWTWIYKNLGESFPGASEPKYFDAELFAEDVATLRQFYQNNGFFHVAVNGSYAIDSARKRAAVLFAIEEGRASSIDSVGYRILPPLPDSLTGAIRNNSLLKIGDRYSAQRLQEERARVLTLLENNGYPGAQSDSMLVERRYSDDNLAITIPIRHRRRLYFGDISVERDSGGAGYVNVSGKLIVDRLGFRTGEVYSSARREMSELNLNRLRIFSTVRVNAFLPPAEDSVRTAVPIRVLLQPKKSFEVSLGPLVNNQQSRLNIGAGAGFTWLNIGGAAQILGITLQYQGNPVTQPDFFWLRLESYQGNATLKFDQPYLFSNATSGFWSLSYVFAREKNRYSVGVVQNVVGAKWILLPELTAGMDWTLEQSQFTRLDPTISATLFRNFGSTSAINYRNSILTATLDRDKTDDFFNPTSGSAQKLVIEEAGIFTSLLERLNLRSNFQNTQYVKTEGSLRWFRDLSDNATDIFAAKLRAGAIFRYGESRRLDIPIPFNRTYYAGGSNSVRGWSAKELAVDSTKQDIGSNALLEMSAEIRWNAFHEKKLLGIDLTPFWIVLFADAGNLWNEFALIRMREIALAAGIGIRYSTPFGPIRVDFGMRMYDPARETNPWVTQRRFFPETFSLGVLHLGIAHAF